MASAIGGRPPGAGGRGRDEVRDVPVAAILHSPYQARISVGEDELRELADSIRQHGLLQPVLVRPFGKGYELVAGERRLRACKLLGVKRIPAVVRPLSDEEAAVLGLVENLQRENLGFFEEARGYQRMTDDFGMTQQQLAAMLGRSQPAVANKLRLLRLSGEVQRVIIAASLSERHARALLRLDSETEQLAVIAEMAQRELTVRDAEELIEQRRGGAEARPGPDRRVVHVVKDIRIFLNSFRQAVKLLRRTGVGVEMEERDTVEEIELIIRIPKGQR